MKWLGTRTRIEGQFRPAGLGRPSPDTKRSEDTLLVRGGLVAQVEVSPTRVPINLIKFSALDPWPTSLSIVQEPDGTIRLLLRQGTRHLAVGLRTTLGATTETVLVTYSWDAPRRQGGLSVYAPDRAALWHAEVMAPFPLTLRDARRILLDDSARTLAETVEALAIADDVVPVGPLPGIGQGALVDTVSGPAPIETLRPGDLLGVASGDRARVLWAGALELPAVGRFAPLTVRAPYHMLSKDMVLAPDQRILLGGSEIEYLFGEERVSTAIRNLSDRQSVRPNTDHGGVVTYWQVLLERPEAIRVNGAWIESLDHSLFLSERSLLSRSVLADLPEALLPDRPGSSVPVLKGYEALTIGTALYG